MCRRRAARATRTSCSTPSPVPTAIPPTPAIPTTGPCAPPTMRACSRSTWARPARTSSCSRPSSTRSTPTPASRRPAWSTACSWPTRWAPCSRPPTTAPTSGTCAIGYATGGNDSSSLYGWRQGGDYGLIGSPGGSAPATGTYVPYPTYFAEELASKIIQAGGNVVQASSSDPNLTTYAVLEAERPSRPAGHQQERNQRARPASSSSPTSSPAAQATVWQYGEAQDTAQSQSTTGASALANFTATLTVNGSTFSYSFPAYSMTVLVLGKASSGTAGPTITQAASATPSPVTGKTTVLSVSATDPSGTSGLTYTWITTGTPPAAVTFSANGTNAAQSVTATFTEAGSYTFQVTVTDPSGYIVTSSVTVVVNQSLTTIKVSPSSITVAAAAARNSSRHRLRPVRQPDRDAAGLHVVGDERGRHDRRQQRPLHGPRSGRDGDGASRQRRQSPARRASPSRRRPAVGATAAFSLVSVWNTGFEASIIDHQHGHDGDQQLGLAVQLRGHDHSDLECDDRQPYRHAVRDRQRGLQQHDRAGPERDISASSAARAAYRSPPTNYVLNGTPITAVVPPPGPAQGDGRRSPTSTTGGPGSRAISRSRTRAPRRSSAGP